MYLSLVFDKFLPLLINLDERWVYDSVSTTTAKDGRFPPMFFVVDDFPKKPMQCRGGGGL